MSAVEPQLPQWWNDHIDAAWNRARAAALSDWKTTHPVALGGSLVEDALAFGHGARMAKSSLTTWDSISSQLRSDWIRLGHVGPAAWERVQDIIRHEWQRAAGPDSDAAPERRRNRADL